jgi:hypothetical protein
MYVKKLVPLTVAMAVLFLAGAAFAGSIDFGFSGNDSTSTWSWAGTTGTSVTASADNVTLGVVGSGSQALTGTVLLSFTSGPNTGGTGTLSNPFTFGPDTTASITVTGTIPGCSGSGCSGTLFTGGFLIGEAAYTGNGNLDFTGQDVSGTVSAGVAALLGLSGDTNVVGSLSAILVCSTGFYDGCMSGYSGLVGSGNLILTPGGNGFPSVPEPSALFLLGSGLCGLAFYVRRRVRA